MIPVLMGGRRRRRSLPPVARGASFVAIATPEYTASDASHLVPCVDGASIRWWKDAVTGTWYERSAVGSAPILRGSAGNWRADWSGANGRFDFVGTIWPAGALSLVTRFTTSSGLGQVFGGPDAGGNHPFNFYRNGSAGPIRRWDSGPQQTLADATAYTISYSGTDAVGMGSVERMRADGGSWNTVNDARPTRAGQSQTFWIGTGASGTFFAMPSFKAVCLFPTVLSDADFSAVETWIGSL